jgi:NADH-quinone oxidoreductase subunit K
VTISPTAYVLVSAAVFCTGVFGLLTRDNALMFLISVELMINAANINLVGFSLHHGNVTGQLLALFAVGLAAAEVAVGIGIFLGLYRNFDDVDVTLPAGMRW